MAGVVSASRCGAIERAANLGKPAKWKCPVRSARKVVEVCEDAARRDLENRADVTLAAVGRHAVEHATYIDETSVRVKPAKLIEAIQQRFASALGDLENGAVPIEAAEIRRAVQRAGHTDKRPRRRLPIRIVIFETVQQGVCTVRGDLEDSTLAICTATLGGTVERITHSNETGGT